MEVALLETVQRCSLSQLAERSRRVELTVENARWMRANAGDGLRLFGSIQVRKI